MTLHVRYRFEQLSVAPELMFYLEKQIRDICASGDVVSVEVELGEAAEDQITKPYFIRLGVTASSGQREVQESGDNLFILARDLFESFREAGEREIDAVALN